MNQGQNENFKIHCFVSKREYKNDLGLVPRSKL